MQNLLHDNTSVTRPRVNRPGFAAMAVILLALGVGAATAVFALADRALPHAARGVPCETMMDFSTDPSAGMAAGLLATPELTDRVSDVYETSFEAANDAIESLPDVAQSLTRPLVLALLGAGALAILVACTRAASTLVDSSRIAALAAGTTVGALAFATMSLRALALPAVGLRSVAFAGCVSLLAVGGARAARVKPASSEA